MSHIQRYLKQMSYNLDCDVKTKQEILEEFRDHLNLLKQDYVERGLSEDIAEKCAVYDFDEHKMLQQKMNKALNPFQRTINAVMWFLFSLYIWFAAMALIVGKINQLKYGQRGITLTFDWGTYSDYNLIPFKYMFREIYNSIFWIDTRNTFDITFFTTGIGIVLLFMPLGFFLPRLCKANTLKKLVLYTLVIAIAIEGFQYITNTGYLNVNDILYYVSGACMGWFIYSYFQKTVGSRAENLKRNIVR